MYIITYTHKDIKYLRISKKVTLKIQNFKTNTRRTVVSNKLYTPNYNDQHIRIKSAYNRIKQNKQNKKFSIKFTEIIQNTENKIHGMITDLMTLNIKTN